MRCIRSPSYMAKVAGMADGNERMETIKKKMKISATLNSFQNTAASAETSMLIVDYKTRY